MINAGGPIWSLDWCTSCEDKGAQYAVVCVHPKTPVYVGRTYPGTTQSPPPLHQLIQLWEFDMKNLTENPPKVRYYVEHNHGFVWDIRWMPCTLDDNDDRLGIVAVAFSDNSLVLYSLPKPETINFEGEGVPTIRLTEQVYTIKNTIPVFLKVKDTDEETEAEAQKKKKSSKKGKKKEDESIEEEELEEEEEELPAPDEYTKVMRSVAWSPSLEYLAVGSISGSVLLYKVNHNKQDCVLKLLMDNIGHYQQKQFSPVNNVTWSSLDSNIFATVGNSGDVCVWDVRDMMQPIYSQTMTRQISNQVAFPKGINAFIVAAETLVKQYDAIDGVSIFLSKQDSATWGMSVTSTRSGFMTTNASGAAYLYSLEEDGIGKKKKGVAGRIDERIIKVRNVHNQLCIGLPHHNITPLEHMLDVEDTQTKRKDVDLKAYDPKVALSCIQFHPRQEYNYWTLVGGVSGVLMLLKIPTKYSIKAKK
jgi:WD40 repeat protein